MFCFIFLFIFLLPEQREASWRTHASLLLHWNIKSNLNMNFSWTMGFLIAWVQAVGKPFGKINLTVKIVIATTEHTRLCCMGIIIVCIMYYVLYVVSARLGSIIDQSDCLSGTTCCINIYSWTSQAYRLASECPNSCMKTEASIMWLIKLQAKHDRSLAANCIWNMRSLSVSLTQHVRGEYKQHGPFLPPPPPPDRVGLWIKHAKHAGEWEFRAAAQDGGTLRNSPGLFKCVFVKAEQFI